MNKGHLVRALEQAGYPQPDFAVTLIFETIAKSLACGEPVMIRGFGRFEVRPQSPVTRFNPTSREPVDVPGKIAVGFLASPNLKRRVQNARP
jgi:DNA-binding protein HU-beta